MSSTTVASCPTIQFRTRIGLAAFGEPQLCPDCGKPLEFARPWQRTVLTLQFLSLALAAFLPIRGHGLLTIGICFGVLALLQLTLWLLAPIRHQTSAAIQRRNRFYLAATTLILLFALFYSMWVRHNGL